MKSTGSSHRKLSATHAAILPKSANRSSNAEAIDANPRANFSVLIAAVSRRSVRCICGSMISYPRMNISEKVEVSWNHSPLVVSCFT
mgnify:CR=1 FL=1